MPVRIIRGSRASLAVPLVVVAGAVVPAAQAQTSPTLQATTSISGAISSQTMNSGIIAATTNNQATASDSFSGPLPLGSATVNVSASASEGVYRLSSQTSAMATIASLPVLTSTEAKATDSVQVTQLPGGQGQLSVMYFPTTLANGAMISGSGGSGSTWLGTLQFTATLQDIAADGTPGAAYTLAANYTNGNLGPSTNDTGPVSIPVRLNDTLTINVDEKLSTSSTAARQTTAGVTANATTHLFLVPLSPGLAFTSASGHSYLPLAGDVDVDGKVNFTDLLTLAQHYNSTGAAWPEGDFNADGTVDFGDLLALAQNYGQSVDGPQLTALPEPTAVAPVALAAAGFLGYRRRTSQG